MSFNKIFYQARATVHDGTRITTPAKNGTLKLVYNDGGKLDSHIQTSGARAFTCFLFSFQSKAPDLMKPLTAFESWTQRYLQHPRNYGQLDSSTCRFKVPIATEQVTSIHQLSKKLILPGITHLPLRWKLHWTPKRNGAKNKNFLKSLKRLYCMPRFKNYTLFYLHYFYSRIACYCGWFLSTRYQTRCQILVS